MRKRKCCAGGVLENIYKKMRDTDFALLCDDESIPCHKNILVGASSVFEATIGNKKNKEAEEGEVDMNNLGRGWKSLCGVHLHGQV